MPKIMEIIEKETKGKSYHTYKYSYDSIGLPSIDYDDDPNKVMKWKDSGETGSSKKPIDLKPFADQLQSVGEKPLLKYFLDGSRHVFKVDDIAYNKQVFPVVAGQIGIGCCKRENKRMSKERFYRELVLALPDKANADGWDDAAYFAAKVKKLNESEELKRLGLHFSAIIPYSTSKAGSPDTKLDNLAVGVIQDYMIEAEKRMVAELVKDKRLGQDAYLLKDGSLEYKVMKSGREDLRTLQKIKHNYSWVIGVSKSFNPESCLDHTGKPNSNYIADLPVFHRTPVARYENREFLGDVQFGVWYITDAASFLTNFISSDFGDVNAEENTLRIGMNYVTAKVVCNTENIYIPLQSNAKVMLATAEEINYALGLNDIRNPLVCGYLEMYEGTKGCEKVTLPVNLNSKFIIGPEGAHLNISGISGLASKTSYAMFLLKAIQDSYMKKDPQNEDEDSVAFVLFNVKGKDLLAIDQLNDFSDERNPEQARKDTFAKYEKLGLAAEPFKNVQYYYPYSIPKTRHWNTYMTPEEVEDNIKKKKAKKYKYIYKYDKENLDLMFANIDDSTQTMESIISYIMSGQGKFNQVSDWQEFLEAVKEKCSSETSGKDKEIPVASWRKFYRIINKSITDNKIFARDIREDEGETRIGDALKYIKKNEVHVIDIAKLSEDKQAYVFGDAIRTIYDLQLGQYAGEEGVNPPSRVVIFIDELNKYASKETPKNSPILRQVLDVAERGRSLGVVLFAAEQFRSAIHDRVTGNCSTHAYGRTNSIEVTKSDYKSIPSVYKTMMTRLKQGEYIIQNPIFRSLLNIKFPKPIYKQFK